MREAKLTRMIRIALLPTLAAGFCVAASAQNNTASSDPATSGTPTSVNGKSMPADSKASANTGYRGMRASKMIGMEVHNPKGENIGKINDLVVDMRTGDVLYSILEFDPGIFQGERLFAVPTKQLRMDAKGEALVYNMTRDKLVKAADATRDKIEKAGVDRSAWDTTFRDPNYMRNMNRNWGVQQPANNARAMRVSDLIGEDVNSRSGDGIGEIEDVVVNMGAQKVHYAVLKFDPSMASAEKRYLFPLRSFSMKPDSDDLTLDVDKNMLARMKSYPADGYDSLNDQAFANEIDRYFVAVLPVTGTSTGHGATMQKGQAQGMDSAAMDSSFKRYDSNGDGQISREEFMAHAGANAKRVNRSEGGTLSK